MRKLWAPVGAFFICAAVITAGVHYGTHRSNPSTTDEPVARLCQVPDSMYPKGMDAFDPPLFEYCGYIPSRYKI